MLDRGELAAWLRLTESLGASAARRLLAMAGQVEVHRRKGDEALACRLADDLAAEIQTNDQTLSPASTLQLAEALLTGGQTGLGSELMQFLAERGDWQLRVQSL